MQNVVVSCREERTATLSLSRVYDFIIGIVASGNLLSKRNYRVFILD